jgi:putative hydrolase
VRKGSETVLKELVQEAVRQKLPLAVTSDAHFMDKVGEFTHSLQLIKGLKVPAELIINTSLGKMEKYIL